MQIFFFQKTVQASGIFLSGQFVWFSNDNKARAMDVADMAIQVGGAREGQLFVMKI
jgi:hypothetical protein